MTLRIGYGAGTLIAILAPFILLLLGIASILQTLFLVFLLFGLWTLVVALAIVKVNERKYYLSWGLMLVGISSFFVIPIVYAFALMIALVIASILITYTKRA